MGKCREALGEEGCDVDRAVEWLRKRGVRSMEKRTADAGEALLAISLEPSAGAIVELRAETDFVTRNEIFQQLSVALARTAAQLPGGGTGLQDAPLKEGLGLPKQVRDGASVGDALLELGSVLGERIVLGEVRHLAAPPAGVIAGYAHPKQADALPGTGRMAALVAIRASPPLPEAADRLRSIAVQLARHVVAAQPRFTSIANVPAETLHKERETVKAAHLEQLGPAKASKVDPRILSKVVEGKTQKFYQDTVLLCQELIAPQTAGEGSHSEPKAVPVTEWLQAEARSMGLEQVLVEDFRLACL